MTSDPTRSARAYLADDRFESLSVPVTRASTILFGSAEAFERRYERFYDGYTYGLHGTPISRALEAQIMALYRAERALCTPSGQAATALALTALLRAGDRVLVTAGAYGSTRAFCTEVLAGFGVSVALYDPELGAGIAGALDPRTRLVIVESPGSVAMEVQDLPAIARAARASGAIVLADNSWASALLCNPLDLGADIVVESLSKHVGGHGDLLLGALVTRDEDLFRRLKDTARLLGLGVPPDDASLALRGLQTLALRLEREGASALALAQWLATRPEIARVLHPALPEHPGHALWKRDFRGASGLFSVALAEPWAGREAEVIDALRRFRIGASFGSAQSIVSPQRIPSPSDGPGIRLIRLSVGLEPVEDLKADLEAALDGLAAGGAPTRSGPTTYPEGVSR